MKSDEPDAPYLTKAGHLDLQFKADENTGEVVGYGSKWGLKDSYGEIVIKGAFTDSLKEYKDAGDVIPMLWQHNSAMPIGVWTDFKEDDTGLALKGKVNKETARGRDALSDMKMRAVKGLSIGYYELVTDSWGQAEKQGFRNLYKLDLREVSPVTFPALREAQIEGVKTPIAEGGLTLRRFEIGLREKFGISRKDSEFIALNGFEAWCQREVGANDDMTELQKAVAELRKAASTSY